MNNKEYKNHIPEHKSKKDDENVVFVPLEDIQAIERVINNWEPVKQEWKKLNVDS